MTILKVNAANLASVSSALHNNGKCGNPLKNAENALHMKIVCLKGGLGNQLFEYCRYHQLLEEGHERTYLFYDPRRLKSHGRALLTDGFDVQLPSTPFWVQLLVHGIKLLRELHVFPRLYDDQRPDCLLIDDYSQDRRFIKDAKRWLPFRTFSLSHATQHLKEQIEATPQSVALHVRRGDYLHPTNLPHFGLCPLDYYQQAMAYIRRQYPETTFFIFSDDVKWAEQNLQDENAVFVHPQPNESDVIDLYLMSLCRHHILANSTFSFWAAWLSLNDGINIYPSRWFADSTWHIPDIFPAHWIGLNTPLLTTLQ